MTNQTPAPFQESKPGAQLLIFSGLTGISIFLFMMIMVLMQATGKVDLIVIDNATSFIAPDILKLLKILQIISTIVIFMLPVFIFAFLVSRNRLSYLQLDRLGKVSILLIGGVLMLVASPLINFLAELNEHLQLPQWMKDSEAKDDALSAAFLNHQTLYDLIVNLVMIALVAAVSEELFFRGVMQKLLIKMTKNVHVGIWITGAIFSAIHLQFYGFFPRMLMGVYLGYLFVWSGSLWVTIFAHFVNNATAVLLAYLEEHKMVADSIDKVGTQSSEYGAVIISTVLVIFLLFVIHRLAGKKITEENIASL